MLLLYPISLRPIMCWPPQPLTPKSLCTISKWRNHIFKCDCSSWFYMFINVCLLGYPNGPVLQCFPGHCGYLAKLGYLPISHKDIGGAVSSVSTIQSCQKSGFELGKPLCPDFPWFRSFMHLLFECLARANYSKMVLESVQYVSHDTHFGTIWTKDCG